MMQIGCGLRRATLLVVLTACASDKERGTIGLGDAGLVSCEPFDTRPCEGALACQTQALQTCFPAGDGWSACACPRPGVGGKAGAAAGGEAGGPADAAGNSAGQAGDTGGAGGARADVVGTRNTSMSATSTISGAGGSQGSGGEVSPPQGGAPGSAGPLGMAGLGGELND